MDYECFEEGLLYLFDVEKPDYNSEGRIHHKLFHSVNSDACSNTDSDDMDCLPVRDASI